MKNGDKQERPEIESESFEDDKEVYEAIKQNKLKIRKIVRDNPEAYKEFLKDEYQRAYKLKKISKKKANIVTIPILIIMGYGIYEAANIVLGLKLPSIISMIGI